MRSDAELVERHLRASGLAFVVQCVATEDAFARALEEFHPDVVLADYSLPHFDGLSAIRLVHEKRPGLPVIVVTGILGDEAAAGVIKAGANDYILKDRLARLGPAVERAVQEAEQSAARKRADELNRQQNLELEEQNRQVRAANEAKNEFLANMSHELRSPLNGIIGFTELLYDGKLGPLEDRQKEFLGRVHNSSMHLLHLINAVLDLTKVDAGWLEFHPERVAVPQLIQEVIDVLGALAAQKSIHIETEIEAAVREVHSDPVRLKQILYNFLSNALKFTGDGGRVVVRWKAEGDNEVRLEVADTGIGIPEKDFGRLFTEFQQLDASAARSNPGTGLGLALTKRVVEAQGGRVGVHSTLGQGSTFYAILPRTVQEGPAASRIARVLVVEDDQEQRFLMTRILEAAGCRVETANTGAQALEKCHRASFDAITLDWHLPDRPSWDVLSEIRSWRPHRETPVIVVSPLEKDAVPIQEHVQGFVTEPVRAEEFLEALARAGVLLRPGKVAR